MLNTSNPKGLRLIAMEGSMTQHSKTNESIEYTISIVKIQTERIDNLFLYLGGIFEQLSILSAWKGA